MQLWNLSDAFKEVNEFAGQNRSVKRPKDRPIFSFLGHQREGYGLAWSSLKTGLFFHAGFLVLHIAASAYLAKMLSN